MDKPEAAVPATKVLIIDDDDVFRRTTARILERHGYSCHQASSAAAARDILDNEPDVAVALCDIRMPGTAGMELLAELTPRFPDVAVVMTTAVDDPHVAEEAFQLGALGYMTKPFEVNELLINVVCALRRRDLEHAQRLHLRALEDTLAGREALITAIVAARDDEPIISTTTLAPVLRQLPPTERGLGADLTHRELEVLELMAGGLINKQVARQLSVRLNTVRNHSQNILYKLRAHSRLEAVAIAVRDGLIAYPDQPANR